MSTEQFWFGYLDAGAKSSPVLRDDTIKSSNPENICLFNLQKNQIIEYKVDIVSQRLQDLDDSDTIAELTAKYEQAKQSYLIKHPPHVPDETPPTIAANDPIKPKKNINEIDEPLIDFDDELPWDDDDD